VLAFDVEIMDEVVKYAEEGGVQILNSSIIYQLLDEYNKFVKNLRY